MCSEFFSQTQLFLLKKYAIYMFGTAISNYILSITKRKTLKLNMHSLIDYFELQNRVLRK